MLLIIFRFIGEEGSSESKSIPELTNDPTWIIDPIDGTTNFVHTFPFSCISVGLTINKESVVGITYNPNLEQLFSAQKGKGAYLNGERIYASKVDGKKNILFDGTKCWGYFFRCYVVDDRVRDLHSEGRGLEGYFHGEIEVFS